MVTDKRLHILDGSHLQAQRMNDAKWLAAVIFSPAQGQKPVRVYA